MRRSFSLTIWSISSLIEANAAWQGERIKMVRSWAVGHETLWLKDYADLRSTYDKDDPQSQRLAHERATAFYREHRTAMDAGCVVSWDFCCDDEIELSAIQHAYNALIDDGPEVFASEYQNEPLPQATVSTQLSAEEIVRKVNGHKRRLIPQDAQRLTAFVDVQKDALFYAVTAWSDAFTGFVVDYGVYPDQKRERFTLRDIRKTLAKEHPGAGLEASLYAGLTSLAENLLGQQWTRDDGSKLSIERLLIDANWGDSTDVVYKFCRQSGHRGVLVSKSRHFRAGQFAWAERRQAEEWRTPRPELANSAAGIRQAGPACDFR